MIFNLLLKKLYNWRLRKKLIPFIDTENPIIDDLVDLAIEFHYEYDTIYDVYTEWDSDIGATRYCLVTAMYMGIDPWDITKERIGRMGDVIRKSRITIGDD